MTSTISKFKGETFENYRAMRDKLASILTDRRPMLPVSGISGGGDPMEIGEIDVDAATDSGLKGTALAKQLAEVSEMLCAFNKGKGKGGKSQEKWPTTEA